MRRCESAKVRRKDVCDHLTKTNSRSGLSENWPASNRSAHPRTLAPDRTVAPLHVVVFRETTK